MFAFYVCAWSGIPTNNVQLFSYYHLRSATENFHPSKKIGGGGYGVVHKVRLTSFTLLRLYLYKRKLRNTSTLSLTFSFWGERGGLVGEREREKPVVLLFSFLLSIY